jgi:hypothetical protein
MSRQRPRRVQRLPTFAFEQIVLTPGDVAVELDALGQDVVAAC